MSFYVLCTEKNVCEAGKMKGGGMGWCDGFGSEVQASSLA